MPKQKQARSKGAGRRTKPRPMTKPAMMDWALRLLRLLNERKTLTSRIVADEFGVTIRTAQRYLLYLSALPCVIPSSYRKSGKRYTVEPYRILYTGGFWYLAARHDGTLKKFLLDMIERVRPAGRTYAEIPEPIRKALAEAHNPWFHDAPPDRVTVEFDAEVAHFFERKPFFPLQEIVEKKGNGNLVLSFDAHNEMDLREHLARWMPYFRVLSPDRYREYVAKVAGECLDKNRQQVTYSST